MKQDNQKGPVNKKVPASLQPSRVSQMSALRLLLLNHRECPWSNCDSPVLIESASMMAVQVKL